MKLAHLNPDRYPVGTRVKLSFWATVRDTGYGNRLSWSSGSVALNAEIEEIIKPNPPVPTKVGAIVKHSELGLMVLRGGDAWIPGFRWVRLEQAHGISPERTLTESGTFEVIFEGVDE